MLVLFWGFGCVEGEGERERERKRRGERKVKDGEGRTYLELSSRSVPRLKGRSIVLGDGDVNWEAVDETA